MLPIRDVSLFVDVADREADRGGQGQDVRQDHAVVPKQVAVAALGVLPRGSPGDAGKGEHHRGPGNGRLSRSRSDKVTSVVAFPEAGEARTLRVEVVHAGGKPGEVGAAHVDLDRVQGPGGGVVAEVQDIAVAERLRVVDAGAEHEESGQGREVRAWRGVEDGGGPDRLHGRNDGGGYVLLQGDPLEVRVDLEGKGPVAPVKVVRALPDAHP
jgi:hypothetical protein